MDTVFPHRSPVFIRVQFPYLERIAVDHSGSKEDIEKGYEAYTDMMALVEELKTLCPMANQIFSHSGQAEGLSMGGQVSNLAKGVRALSEKHPDEPIDLHIIAPNGRAAKLSYLNGRAREYTGMVEYDTNVHVHNNSEEEQ